MSISKEKLEKLRAVFPPDEIEKLPRYVGKKENGKIPQSAYGMCNECGKRHPLPAIHLDYVGHAGITERLNDVDPEWNWEPLALDERGLPAKDEVGGMWIRLTVLGVTRLGYGDAQGKVGPNAVKEIIGDAIRNAAMRFGVATYLWSKSEKAEHMREFDDHEDKPSARQVSEPKVKDAKSRLVGIVQDLKVKAKEKGVDIDAVNQWYRERYEGRSLDKLNIGELEELQTHLMEAIKQAES